MSDGVSYTSTKPLEEFEINKKNKPSDLISRQDAKDTVVDTFHAVVKKENIYISAIITAIVQEIGKLPSAQKTGKWVATDKGLKVTRYECSECKREVVDDTGYDVVNDYPYCHCGARMEREV